MITCNTTHVVYFLWCPCGQYNVGCTKRTLKKRISEHIANIKNGIGQHIVSLHFRQVHIRDTTVLQFCGIDQGFPSWRGSNKVRETNWIYLLNTLTPKGLNIDLDLYCFISNY